MTPNPRQPWDGRYEHGTIPRPGYKDSWIYHLRLAPDGIAWTVMSPGAIASKWRGLARTPLEARAAAGRATEPVKLPRPMG